MLLAKFAPLGIAPKAIPSVLEFIKNPLEQLPVQQGTDLKFIEGLASAVGHVFYLEPGPVPGVSTAYWGPEIRAGVPQPALSVDMDAATNVESLSFTYDGLAKTLPIVHVQPPRSKVPFPVPGPTSPRCTRRWRPSQPFVSAPSRCATRPSTIRPRRCSWASHKPCGRRTP